MIMLHSASQPASARISVFFVATGKMRKIERAERFCIGLQNPHCVQSGGGERWATVKVGCKDAKDSDQKAHEKISKKKTTTTKKSTPRLRLF